MSRINTLRLRVACGYQIMEIETVPLNLLDTFFVPSKLYFPMGRLDVQVLNI